MKMPMEQAPAEVEHHLQDLLNKAPAIALDHEDHQDHNINDEVGKPPAIEKETPSIHKVVQEHEVEEPVKEDIDDVIQRTDDSYPRAEEPLHNGDNRAEEVHALTLQSHRHCRQ